MDTRWKRLRLVTLVLVTVIVVAGCGGDDDGGADGDGDDSSASADGGGVSDDGEFIVITITDLSFPAEVTVPVDRSLSFHNESGTDHVVVWDTLDGEPADLPDFELGNTAQFGVPMPPGTWEYHCSIHPSMTGTIVSEA